VAPRGDARRREGAWRLRAARPDLAPGRRRASVHERHLRRAGSRAHPDVRDRRQRAPGGIHARRDDSLRGVGEGEGRARQSTLMLASLMTFAYRAASVWMNWPKNSGVLE